MPAPLARGIIITVSILVAAGLAAYENEQIREWIDRTRHKIAMGLHSLGDDINPQRSSRRSIDASMVEEKGDAAEERRQRLRAEILERGRVMEERQKRRKTSKDNTSSSPSFDSLVDEQGVLRSEVHDEKETPVADTSAVETIAQSGTLRSRHPIPTNVDVTQSVDATLPVRQLTQTQQRRNSSEDLFESQYEREMRTTWNIPLPPLNANMPSSHASESLLDLTPTTEEAPDPEISVPNAGDAHQTISQSDYFSAASSRASTHTLSDAEPEYYYTHPSRPLNPIQPHVRRSPAHIDYSVSSVPSVAGSTDVVNPSDADASEDDLMSDFGDGIHTPASAWTEVGSTVSDDA